MSALKDLTNLQFDKLTAKYIHSKDRNRHIRWHCVCECGNTHDVLSTHLVSGMITHCGCCHHRGSNHKQWTGVGEISGNLWDSIKRGASGYSRAKLEFTITIEYVWELFVQQGRVCVLSGLPIWFPHTETYGQSRTASLDRIDSSQGYIPGNVQWVHKDINKMKNSYDQEHFILMCEAVARHTKR